jgi:iron complex transport system substrate-binding protein
MRVVSLLPSATETVCALGAGADLVGVSHECDFPPSVRQLPALTSARLSSAASSLEIDQAVRAVIRNALSIYTVDQRQLAELSPDLILTQDLCQVCAVSLDEVQSAVARLANREQIRIVSLSPTRLRDVFLDIERVGSALGRIDAASELRTQLEARISAVSRRAAMARRRPRVISIEWLEPLMLGGTWMPELIELAGGEAVAAIAGEPAPTISVAELSRLAPDVVLIKPCGFTVQRSLEERATIERSILNVVGPSARVWVADGNAYFNRPGPRLVESLEILAACIHPELFSDFVEKHAAATLRVSSPGAS